MPRSPVCLRFRLQKATEQAKAMFTELEKQPQTCEQYTQLQEMFQKACAARQYTYTYTSNTTDLRKDVKKYLVDVDKLALTPRTGAFKFFYTISWAPQ